MIQASPQKSEPPAGRPEAGDRAGGLASLSLASISCFSPGCESRWAMLRQTDYQRYWHERRAYLLAQAEQYMRGGQ